MVSLKTKANKHALDNEKRRRSIKEKEKIKLSQSQIIKEALSNASLITSSNKKIVFNDGDEDCNNIRSTDSKKSNGKKNFVLFSDSDCEEETPTIKEKIQFSGKKGFELLSLQSTYGNDERFKIDERFLEEEKEDSEVDNNCNTSVKNDTDPTREKNKMLSILKGVLGESEYMQESTKVKKRQFDMIRYDASKKEHEIYEIKSGPEVSSSYKKKKLKKLVEGNAEEQYMPQVSKEKFFKVSKEIKNSFKENEEEGPFSLLQTYGRGDVEDMQEVERYEGEENEVMSEEAKRKTEKKEGKQKVALKEEKKVAVAQGIWKENFFFEENDPRFKDCLEFINKKNSTEAVEAAENYDQTRKRLKEILRLHMKKQLLKKETFRNKIGGRNKKQLAISGAKNRVLASKRKPPKMNSGRKI